MRNLRLYVENFACIQKLDVVFKDYTIFIGEQASGKSVTCKLYYFLRDATSSGIVSSCLEDKTWAVFNLELKESFFKIFPEYSWKESDFLIQLKNDQDTILQISHERGKAAANFEFSAKFKKEFNEFKSNFKITRRKIEAANKKKGEEFPFLDLEYTSMTAFRLTYKEYADSDFIEDVTYIPSGRSFFSVIRDNVFGFLSENIGIDPFLKSFGKFYEFSKRVNQGRRGSKQDLSAFDSLSSTILKGEFLSEKKSDWLVQKGRRIQVANASSGQQEALPLIMGLRALLISKPAFGIRSVIVEEPEAHLFPISQKAIIELLFLARTLGADSRFIITTHSPYVLSCINNELLKHQGDAKASIAAYFLSNGKAVNIVDKETGLINGEDLDKISNQISAEFYEILERTE